MSFGDTIYTLPALVGSTTPYTAAVSRLSTENLYLPNGSATTSNLYTTNLTVSGTCTGCSGSSASTTLLTDHNTFSGINLFTNSSSDFSGTWQTFSPSHFQVAGSYLTALTASYPIVSSGGLTPNLTWAGLSTTTQPSSGNVLTSNGASGVYGTATSTLSASSPLTGSFTQLGSGGSLGCQTASGSQAGCLSSADWTTFNGKQASLTFTYPLVNTANTISSALSTTTSNTWGGTQTFTNAIVVGGTTGSATSTFSTGITVGTGYSPYPEYSFNADTNTGLDSTAPDVMNLVNAGVNTITLNSSNKVGVGTSSPSQKLSVQGNVLISGNISSVSSITATSTLTVSGTTTLQDLVTGDSGYVSPYGYFNTGYGATTTAWTGTSTPSLTPIPFNGTIKNALCYTTGGTVNVDMYDNTTSTHLTLMNVSSSATTYTFSSNNTFSAHDVYYFVAGTPVSSPTYVTCLFGFLRTN